MHTYIHAARFISVRITGKRLTTPESLFMEQIMIILAMGVNIVVLLGIIWSLATRLATIETNIKWLMEAEFRRTRHTKPLTD